MRGFLRDRGITVAVAGTVACVVVAAWCARWLESRRWFTHFDRIPADVLGSLLVALLAASTLKRLDLEIEQAAPRPSLAAELALPAGITALACGLAVALFGDHQLERGGLEFSRDAIGLVGLALISAAVTDGRLAWAAPFAWATVSYLASVRDYRARPHLAWPCWLMFPASYPATWVAAGAVLGAGLCAYGWRMAPPPKRWRVTRTDGRGRRVRRRRP